MVRYVNETKFLPFKITSTLSIEMYALKISWNCVVSTTEVLWVEITTGPKLLAVRKLGLPLWSESADVFLLNIMNKGRMDFCTDSERYILLQDAFLKCSNY